MSKWFKYLSNVMIKQTFFSIVFVSDDYMFTLQDSADTEIKLASILIFDATTFNPLKKFNFDYGTLSTISYFYINQKYYIIGILNNNLQIFIVDSSLNYIIQISKKFESSRVTSSIKYVFMVMFNNMFFVAENGPMKGSQGATLRNIIFHKISSDFESKSWEAFVTNNGVVFAEEAQMKNSTAGFDFISPNTPIFTLNFTQLSLTYFYIKSKLLIFWHILFRFHYKFDK